MTRHAGADVRRAQILEAALRCFASRGVHAATVDDVARAARLSKGALYWHFRSKQEIFLALFDAFEASLAAQWEQAGEGPVLPTLEAVGRFAIERLTATRVFLDMWSEFAHDRRSRHRLARAYARTRTALADRIRRGVGSGELRPCEPEGVAAALTALIEGLLVQALVDPDYDARADWPAAWAMAAEGLAAPRATARRSGGRRAPARDLGQ
jgi:AcrR family transcriptional regulator